MRKFRHCYFILLVLLFFITYIFIIIQHKTISKPLEQWNLLPKEEKITELYFSDANNLTRRAKPGEVVSLKYKIRNLEHQDMNYFYAVTVATSGGSITPVKSNLIIKNGETVEIQNKVKINSLEKTRIDIELINVRQKISIWLNK